MKKIFFFASLACMAMFASCSSDDDEMVANNGKTQTVDVKIGLADAGSRVKFGDNIQQTVWKTDDYIQFVGIDAQGKVSVNDNNPIGVESTEEGNVSIVRKNVKLKASEKYFVYHCMVGNGAMVKREFNIGSPIKINNQFEAQTQNAAGDYSHILAHTLYKANDYKTAKELADGIILAPDASILEVSVKNLPVVIPANAAYTVKFFIDNNQKASLTFNNAEGGVGNNLYLAFSPAKVEKEITVEVTYDGKNYRASHESIRQYVAGKIYNATLDYSTTTSDGWTWVLPEDPNEGEGTHVYENVYSNTFMGNLNSWTCGQGDRFIGSSSCILVNTDCVEFVALPAADDQSVITLESPVGDLISLKNGGNRCKYDYNMIGWMKSPEDEFQLLIREGTNGDWTSITPKKYTTGAWHSPIESEYITIPAQFKGKNVQLAFQMKVVWDGPYYNPEARGNFQIKNLVVEGY